MAYDPLDYTEPNVCVDEHIVTDAAGMLVLQPWAVPRLVADVRAVSGGDGKMFPEQALPGRLMIEQRLNWQNDAPVDTMLLVRVTRGHKSWVVSNPNAVQFRDRWTYTIDPDNLTPAVPVTTGIYNSQVGSALDVGTNSVAEPLPGKQWVWAEANCSDEWVGPVPPGYWYNIWYRCYAWTPPPFSDNANKNSPEHSVRANWTRIQLIAFPTRGELLTR